MPFILSLTLAACNQNTASKSEVNTSESTKGTTVASHEMSPEQLGELGAQISKDSSKAKELLSQHGLDEKSFEAKIRKVTEDPEASKRYAAAFEKGKA
jgi:hypothetical protein